MKFENVFELIEARGSGSFDYRYWFWAKKGTSLGIAYARQPIELDVETKGIDAIDALGDIEAVVKSLRKEDSESKLEVVEKKIKANTKRLSGIIDLFGSPIVVNWLNRDPSTVVTIPISRKGDVTDAKGIDVNVIKLFRDPDTHELVTELIDWSTANINDEDGETLNTILAKFISTVFASSGKKKLRSVARGKGIAEIMNNLKFKDDKKGIEIVPFSRDDYKILPKGLIGSKKAVEHISELVSDKNFPNTLKRARSAFN